MPIQSFRVKVPTATAALSPVVIQLKPMARFIREMIGPYCLTANLDISKTGWRLLDRANSQRLIPDTGSEDNAIQVNPGEAGWAPLMPSAQKLSLDDQQLQGPPYEINFQFYNTTGADIFVGGFVRVVEPFAAVDEAMLYEFLTRRNPPREFADLQPGDQAALPMERERETPDRRTR